MSGTGGTGTSVSVSSSKHSVHWFRRGLRLSDNPALLAAVKECSTWRAIFILDTAHVDHTNVSKNKWRFLLQCLEDLDASLRSVNSRLHVIRGQPLEVLPRLFRQWQTTCFTFERDPEPFGRVRDKSIAAMCKEHRVKVVVEPSHTLFNPEKLLAMNEGKAPTTYPGFLKLLSEHQPKVSTPMVSLSTCLKNGKRSKTFSMLSPVSKKHESLFSVPTLNELGLDSDRTGTSNPTTSTSNAAGSSNATASTKGLWYGGESEALKRLERHLQRQAWVDSFGRSNCNDLQSCLTGLSPYLRFGCLSPRLFYYALADLYKQMKKGEKPPFSIFGELLWRDFLYLLAGDTPNFFQVADNPICLPIPWDENSIALSKLAQGLTGYPWIDAIMTQLRAEGWIHPVARQAVATFLTRGHLFLSWEEGVKMFEEQLLDADLSIDALTWMWLSGSTFIQQQTPVYCPVKFGQKMDANGEYIKRFLPVLKDIPVEFVHAPWRASEKVLEEAKCILGKDYPLPMLKDMEHTVAVNAARMQQVGRLLDKRMDEFIHPKSNPEPSITPKEEESGVQLKHASSKEKKYVRKASSGNNGETSVKTVTLAAPDDEVADAIVTNEEQVGGEGVETGEAEMHFAVPQPKT